ncbi:efflux RND transporter permease subunit [Zunongwangia profunda]|jgi:HAE1 family hydrophobic/amphiphilic exporter-1|uniref:efflux RND transporter permease subunit n=1 Tax=Zunongwangia profunda TaxID=398743 RepID=UPI000C8F686D|nr:efflux RND transporter permease subunit [Zunongwangia profunda]MAC64337.1 hydrophobe/amphiphile efflux-1 family RND transporter [Flavobacteriaceae bacterium]MAG87066.1 hydrophobe/amphiphile efflux-1 family RND transporter [Flavobacteriaceae bacterium]MCC4228919.1 efflux RND transporter permease subunit [Zunongwangia profunda]|tara:strand:- start:8014 stop:11154 length:3141 start_codon:yes stop_codon:yes gene_type:complete
MLKTFIERPVLSTVISIIIVILGVLGLSNLPVEQYPDIAPPTVQVTANYTGASAETILESVIIPIEEQINGVEGMTYITSTATNNGTAEITVYFDQNTDPDIDAVNVQNRVALASPLLPQEVTQAGVVTQKRQTSALMFLSFYSENPDYDATFLNNYLNINVVPEFKRVNGVGDVNVFSRQDYAMRIWLDPNKLANYNLVPSDVTAALNEQSLEAAAGTLGQNNGETFSYTIKYPGRYKEEGQYEDIIIKALGNGEFLRLKDVADIQLDAQNYQVNSNTLGHPSVSMAVYQTKGSNAQEIIENIKSRLDELKKDFPEGIDVFIPFDTNEFLNASIDKVVHTLFEAFILVFVVVFIFLQDFRSTLIPAIAVPVSIIGTFFFLNLFGYSINLLTLFALVLAIGIVVDDAIVVVEAVHAKIDEGAKDAQKATLDAMHEISGAIVSITLVMAAVFIPVTFITGPTGVFYEQFGITLIVSIFISAVNALTLSPALCALFLKPHDEHEDHKKKNFLQRFYAAFNRGFNATIHRYGKSLHFLYKNKWITAVILILSAVGIWWTSTTTPTGFVPNEDRGIVFANVELPAGSSLDKTHEITSELYNKVKDLPGVEGLNMVDGFSLLNGQGSNYALGFIKLNNWSQREEDSLSAEAITGKLFGVASTIPDANIIFFAPPSIPGFSASSGVEVNLLDRSGGSFKDLDKANQDFMQSLMSHPEVQYAQSAFNTNYPQYQMDINIPLAKQTGVTISDIFATIQGYVGGIYAADFSRFGKQYRVYIQAYPSERADRDDLNQMFVRTQTGDMSPLSEYVSLERVYGPQSVTRFNLFNSTTLNVAMNPGFSSGDGISIVEEEASKLASNYGIAYSGLTREEVNAGSQTVMIFILCVVFVYFLLSAQYESYLLPFSVILSLPLGIFGAYFSTKLMGLQNNIYFQIALIMLVGLLAKNAILIVEFAIQRRRNGESIVDAAIDGAKARLRPILMTSFAFILGLMPLVLANGVGAAGNRSIGTGAVGGLLIGTILGVFVIPILFILFQWLQEKIGKKPEAVKNTES